MSVPCLPALMGNVPRLLDLDVAHPVPTRFAPNADASLSPASVLPPGVPARHLPLPPNNLPPSSLPSGVLQPQPGRPGILPASNVAGVRASLHTPTLPPFPDISVPPPPLGLMSVSDAAPLNAKETLVQFPASATSAFTPDYVSQPGYYSGYPDQAYHSAENSSSFPALPAGLSSSGIHFGVGDSGMLGDAARLGQPGDAKPAQMSKTARDREARAKKKQRKQAMEPLSVESFLGLSLSKPSTGNDSENDKKTGVSTFDVKPEPTDSTIVEDRKEDDSYAEEISGKVEDASVSVIIIDDPALPGDKTTDGDTAVEAKEYHFDWDAMDDDQMSDVSVSSVHTSDLSSFEDDVEHAASLDPEADNLVSDSSPMKGSQVENSCNESGLPFRVSLIYFAKKRHKQAKTSHIYFALT